MKIIIICILLFTSFGLCYANDSDSTIIIYPKWKLNDIKNIKSYYTVRNNIGTLKIDKESEVKIKDVSDEGFIVLWKILDCKIDSTQTSDYSPSIQEDANQLIGLIYELKFNKNGKFLGLENKNEIINTGNAEVAIKDLKMILPYFDVYNVEYVNNIRIDYIPIQGLNDSVYFTKKLEIVDDSLNKFTLNISSYLDDSQREKLSYIISNSASNYDLKHYAETALSTSIDDKYTLSKPSNWLISKKSIASANDTIIVIEYYAK